MSTPGTQSASFRYFVAEGDSYVLKNKKWGGIVFGLFFFLLGCVAFPLVGRGEIGGIFMMLFMFLLAGVFINAAYTRVVFNPVEKTVERKGPISAFNKKFRYHHLSHVQTIRHSVNFIYIRSSINLYFTVPGKKSNEPLTVGSVRTQKQLDQYFRELEAIMPSVNEVDRP